ncbi:unnamed protein product [Staurois parvus]|uniref:Uncharacterized protein n=1 Tax=Staurois parvus TaxID=386267 RepID=A0ABN9E109_9NEOB|nr:unnamed protein product [Staurois parvus]
METHLLVIGSTLLTLSQCEECTAVQCCPSVPSSADFQCPVLLISAQQCCPSVPNSAANLCLSVLPISATSQCHQSVPFSATY